MNISEKMVKIAENMQKVYDAGYNKGKSEGGDTTEAFEQGRQAERDAFWDDFQDNGNRTAYYYAFINNWTTEIFKPKYPIKAVGDASYMFDSCKIGNQKNPDFDFVENGVILDTSGATSLTYMFRNCKGIKRVGTIDCTSITKDINRTFYWCKVVTIDKLVVKETLKYDNPFAGASYLENITIEGIIGNNISFGDCTKLTKRSIESIVYALDITMGRAETTITLPSIAVNKAFETSEGANDGADSEYFNNIAASARVANWNIVFV